MKSSDKILSEAYTNQIQNQTLYIIIVQYCRDFRGYSIWKTTAGNIRALIASDEDLEQYEVPAVVGPFDCGDGTGEVVPSLDHPNAAVIMQSLAEDYTKFEDMENPEATLESFLSQLETAGQANAAFDTGEWSDSMQRPRGGEATGNKI